MRTVNEEERGVSWRAQRWSEAPLRMGKGGGRTSADALVPLGVLSGAGRSIDDEPCALPEATLRAEAARSALHLEACEQVRSSTGGEGGDAR